MLKETFPHNQAFFQVCIFIVFVLIQAYSQIFRMIGYIQIKGKPDRHKQSGKEIQQEAAYRKRADAPFSVCGSRWVSSASRIPSEKSPSRFLLGVLAHPRFGKEVETMRNRTENDVRKFSEALDRCRRPVFLVSADGAQYNMKSANDYYSGMGRWINDTRGEMEIFTSCFDDEAVMMDFYLKMSA